MLVAAIMEHAVDSTNRALSGTSLVMAHHHFIKFADGNRGWADAALLEKREGGRAVHTPRVAVEVKPISSSFFNVTDVTTGEQAQQLRAERIALSVATLKTSLGQLCSYMYRGNIQDGVLTNGVTYFLVARQQVERHRPVWIVFGPRTITELLDVDQSGCLTVTTTFEAVREDLIATVLDLVAFFSHVVAEAAVVQRAREVSEAIAEE